MDSETAQHRTPMAKVDENARESALGIPEILSRIFDHLSVPISTLHDIHHLNNPALQPSAAVEYRTVPVTVSGNCPYGHYCTISSQAQVAIDNKDEVEPKVDEVHLCKTTLLAAATVCRSFSSPALDALWRQMDCLVPLASLLPLTSDGVAYLQMQNASNEALESFIAYSRRIRVLVYKNTSLLQGKGRTLHISVYATILASRGILLPNLKTLLVPAFDQDALAANGIYIASPSLTSLEIGDLKITTNALETFMMTIGSRAEHLRHVSTGLNVTVSPPVWDRILSSKLRSVELFSPATEVLDSLASFPMLQELKVINPPKPASSLTFPSLKRLSLNGTLTSIMYVLEVFHGPLDSISIIVQAVGTIPPLSELEFVIKTIANRWKQTLTHITFDFGNKNIPGLDFAQDFQPFFSLPLRTFRVLQYPKPLDSPTFLVETTSRFSDIEYLQMPPHVEGQEPTIEDLRTVAKSCPSLRVLSTSINSKSIGDLPSFSHHELEELHVYTSPIDSPKKVVAQLDRTFPYLRRVTTSAPAHLKKWNEVERLLELCHQARRGFF